MKAMRRTHTLPESDVVRRRLFEAIFKRHFLRASTSSVCVATLAMAITTSVFACGWFDGTEHSVRFNHYREGRDFGRLPPLPRSANDESNRLFSWDEGEGGESYEDWQARERRLDACWTTAMAAIQEGDIETVRNKLRDYLEGTGRWGSDWGGRHNDIQKRRNSATDFLDALLAVDQGAPQPAVLAYLKARAVYDDWTANPSPQRQAEVKEALLGVPPDERLKDNVAYLEAATLYRAEDAAAPRAFAKLASRFPKSEKREAAIYMSAVASMKQSRSYSRPESKQTVPPPCSVCRDEDWQAARKGFEQVVSEYPGGKYTEESRGWLAYLHLRAGDLTGALREYYRMLAHGGEWARFEAVSSLRFVRDDAGEEQMRQLETALEREPATALAYAYHSLYNYTLPDWDSYEEGRKGRQEAKESRERQRTVAFATRMMERFPRKSLGGAFVLRLAEAHLELGNDAEAATFARRALDLKVTDDYRAEALWVAGVAEHHLRQYVTAREALTILVAENPNNRYTEGARRYLAMVAEDAGDLAGALEQYLALDYRHDVAYFVDVLMKPDELKSFIDTHRGLAQRDELLYSLAVRLLRDNRWQEARQTLASIRKTTRDEESESLYQHSYTDGEPRRTNSKEIHYDRRVRGVRPHWIDQDMRTANDLERLEREVAEAADDEKKAEALYQFASYQYERSLLFYNPLVWNGERHYLLADLYFRSAYRQPNEGQFLKGYIENHDMASRALVVYLDVVRRFPGTRAARDALYSAAVCHERLANYNNYWREIYEFGGHAGDRMVSYRDVKRVYPDYRYPLGTLGWEPSTRTVNGGPGWAALPKPKPRLTAEARLKAHAKLALKKTRKTIRREVRGLFEMIGAVWLFLRALAECFWFGLGFVMFCLVCGRAAFARELLQEELALCAERPQPEPVGEEKARRNISLSLMLNQVGPQGLSVERLEKFLDSDLRDKWERYAQDTFYLIRQLYQHRRGRSILVLSVATHLIALILLFQLLSLL